MINIKKTIIFCLMGTVSLLNAKYLSKPAYNPNSPALEVPIPHSGDIYREQKNNKECAQVCKDAGREWATQGSDGNPRTMFFDPNNAEECRWYSSGMCERASNYCRCS